MARYIDLEELAKRINDNIKADPMDDISESALIEWCKDECIRQAYAMPTADVVPKSEVIDEFTNRLKEKLYTIPTVYNSHFGRMIDDIAKDMKGERDV